MACVQLSAKEQEKEKAERYRPLLHVKGSYLPEPFSDLSGGWIGETCGVSPWRLVG